MLTKWPVAHLPALIAGTACLVLTAATGAVVVDVLSTPAGHSPDLAVLGTVVSTPTPESTVPTPAPPLPPPLAPPLAPRLPVHSPTAGSASRAGTTTAPAATMAPVHRAAALSAPKPAKPTVDPYCKPGPLPAGQQPDAACDVGKHTGIPDCAVFQGCAWWDSWGAIPGGPADATATARPGGAIVVSWTPTKLDLTGDHYGGPLHEFVVRLFTGTRQLRQYEPSAAARSLTMSGVAPGDYRVTVAELNDSGLSGVAVSDLTVPATATATPTPSFSETPEVTPTPSITPFPTGTWS